MPGTTKASGPAGTGRESQGFRPVFAYELGWRWLPDDGHRTPFGHTSGHTGNDANVCLGGTRPEGAFCGTAGPLPAAVRRTTIALHGLEDPSWMIRSRFGCPHRWVARSDGPPGAWDDGLQTSSVWPSRHFFMEHRRPTGHPLPVWSTSSARCRRESPTWRSDIVSTFSRR